ncbi:MAG: Na/Pi cotransporter family protein, partial [Calditrichae bacterium]|nr:Na/Pi cotransporter family protein [Calditrichia bacterium]
MVSIGRERLKRGFVFSEETLAQFAPYSAKVRESFDLSLKALKENDTVIADKVLNMKNEV